MIFRILIIGFLLIVCDVRTFAQSNQNHPLEKKNKDRGSTTMNIPVEPIPFGLKDLSKFQDAVITYGFYSAKKDSGKQEITISGTGEVTILTAIPYDIKEPQIFIGKIDPTIVIRLLDLIDGSGFMDLEKQYYSQDDKPHPRRVVTLKLLNMDKEVNLYSEGLIAVEQIIMAIKFLTLLSLPNEINYNFFFKS